MNGHIRSNGLSQLWMRAGSVACLGLSAVALPAIAAPRTDAMTAVHAPKPGYSILHSFAGSDGSQLWTGILKGKNGYLYGTASSGGSTGNSGVVYEIAPDGTESTLYNFAGGNDGSAPVSLPRLLADKNGNLYGTTEFGGGSGCSGIGCGTIFEVSPGGTETVLHSFNSATDGATPVGGVIKGKRGSFYGTTSVGGPNGDGTVYQLAASGTLTVVHSFGGSDGNAPMGGLLSDKSGNLYGTTLEGGSRNEGVVFEIAPDGTYTVLHSFAGGASDGEFPHGALVMDASGDLYGATSKGGAHSGGTIFRIAAGGTETLLYSFSPSQGPGGTLSLDDAGNLYGTTQEGGANGLGSIFELATTGTFSTLHSFAGGSGDGGGPIDGVTINRTASHIFGTTSYGGGTGCGGSGCGVVYELKQ